MVSKERNSNIELMRIISMFLIIIWHIISHGNLNIQNDYLKVIIKFLLFICVVHVNSFILASGYFQSKSKFKWGKFCSLFNSTIFYNIIFILIFTLLGFIVINKREVLELIIFEKEGYWFIYIFLLLYLLSPYLNIFIEKLDKKTYGRMLIVLTFVLTIFPVFIDKYLFENNGRTLYSFIYFYLIGAYIRKYPPRENYFIKALSTNLYRTILIGLIIFCAITNYSIYITTENIMKYSTTFDLIFGSINYNCLEYSNILVVIESVAYFLLFESMNFKSNIINKISMVTFGIYLIHDNIFVRTRIYKFLHLEKAAYGIRFLIYILLCALIIFIVSAIIEFIRQKVFKFLYDRKISTKIREKLYSIIRNIKLIDISD